MITVHRASNRLAEEHGGTKLFRTFGDHGYSHLVQIEEHQVPAGGRLVSRPLKNVDVVSWVVEGTMEDRSFEESIEVPRGTALVTTTGPGFDLNQRNASVESPLTVLQFHVSAREKSAEPAHHHRAFPPGTRNRGGTFIVSGEGREDALKIGQDLNLLATLLNPREALPYEASGKRRTWIQCVRGQPTAGGMTLGPGDAATVLDEDVVMITAPGMAEVLVVDLP